jgi:hypothetical protein
VVDRKEAEAAAEKVLRGEHPNQDKGDASLLADLIPERQEKGDSSLLADLKPTPRRRERTIRRTTTTNRPADETAIHKEPRGAWKPSLRLETGLREARNPWPSGGGGI